MSRINDPMRINWDLFVMGCATWNVYRILNIIYVVYISSFGHCPHSRCFRYYLAGGYGFPH